MPKGFLHGIGFLVSLFFCFLRVFFLSSLGRMLCPRVSSTGLVFRFLCFFGFFVFLVFFEFFWFLDSEAFVGYRARKKTKETKKTKVLGEMLFPKVSSRGLVFLFFLFFLVFFEFLWFLIFECVWHFSEIITKTYIFWCYNN